MKHLKLLSLFFILALLSCGSDDDNPVNNEPDKPDPVQPSNKYPNELVGTWQFYSGNPVAVLSSIDENDILNQTFIFVANGNMKENIVHPNRNNQGMISSANGNWMVENKQLKLTDWQGNAISGNYSYKINADSSLSINFNGKTAIYYRQEDVKRNYPDLIVSCRWVTISKYSRMTFYTNGRGCFETYYKNGFYNGVANFTWSYNDNIIKAIYEDRASSIATEEYVINYLNKKSISWTFKNDTACYIREQ